MSDERDAASGRPVKAEQRKTAQEKPAQGDTKPEPVTTPKIVAGSGRGGLSGGADPGSTGAGIAGSDVGVAGIGGQSIEPSNKTG
jgi:hypothetical protein